MVAIGERNDHPVERDGGGGERGETEAERLDRNLAELLQELRVAGLGVQVLFGFLLALPFTSRFAKLDAVQQHLYVADLLLAAAAIILLGGPVAYHRLVFRRHERPRLLRASNPMAIGGLASVALAVSGAVLLVVRCVASEPVAVVASLLVLASFVGVWFALPIATRVRRRAARTSLREPSGPRERSG